MYSKFNLRLLAAVMLAAALPLCVPGAPLKADLSPPEASGEGETVDKFDCKIMEILDEVLSFIEQHKTEFENEFRGNVKYKSLYDYTHHSLPDLNPHSNFSKEACFQRAAQGLLVCTALLKHVDGEYQNISIVNGVNGTIPQLIKQIKANMTNADSVVALTSSQEQQLLKELDSPDHYVRKMMAHSILRSMHLFLINSKQSFLKWNVCN